MLQIIFIIFLPIVLSKSKFHAAVPSKVIPTPIDTVIIVWNGLIMFLVKFHDLKKQFPTEYPL